MGCDQTVGEKGWLTTFQCECNKIVRDGIDSTEHAIFYKINGAEAPSGAIGFCTVK